MKNINQLRLAAAITVGLVVSAIAPAHAEASMTPATKAPVFEPLYDAKPRDIAATRIVHEEKAGTFLENLIVREDGTTLATSFLDGRVLAIGADGQTARFAQLPGPTSGIAAAPDGGVLVAGWDAATEGRKVWVLNAAGEVRRTIPLADVALPNGLTPLDVDRFPGVYLITDSVKGRVMRLDIASGALTVWSDAPELGGFDPTISPAIPAANGIRVHGGYAYVANMQRRLLARIAVGTSGNAGRAETFLDRVFIDDFAIDRKGRIFAATHPYNGVVRIDPDRSLTVVASYDQGLQGATSVAVRQTSGGREELMVTTNGGTYVPPDYGASTAKLVVVPLRR